MSIYPGTYNIKLQRRADFSLALQFKDSAGLPINLTGYSVYAQAWNKDRTTKYADFAVTYTDRATGRVALTLTDTQTATFPNDSYYDVLLEDATLTRNYWLEGHIYASEGYTA